LEDVRKRSDAAGRREGEGKRGRSHEPTRGRPAREAGSLTREGDVQRCTKERLALLRVRSLPTIGIGNQCAAGV